MATIDSISFTGSRIKPSTFRYALCYPDTPGAKPCAWSGHDTLQDARREAASVRKGRRDLCYQDVRIEHADGSLAEYAGPAR